MPDKFWITFHFFQIYKNIAILRPSLRVNNVDLRYNKGALSLLGSAVIGLKISGMLMEHYGQSHLATCLLQTLCLLRQLQLIEDDILITSTHNQLQNALMILI